jgi:hypothetical protein
MAESNWKQLSPDELEDITVRLTNYAAWKVKRLNWQTDSSESLPTGIEPTDLASEAIMKLWSGQRRWNPQNPEWELRHLLTWLKGVVDSLVSHLGQSPPSP